MTQAEVNKLITMLPYLYPGKVSVASGEGLKIQARLWHISLGDIDYRVAEMALKKYVLESPFPPTIHDLRKRCIEIMTPANEKLDSSSAWGQVMNAMRKHGYYHEREALNSLSPVVREVVEIMGFQNLCLSENNMADRAHFIKLYDSRQERRKQDALLPITMRMQIANIGEPKTLLLEEKNG